MTNETEYTVEGSFQSAIKAVTISDIQAAIESAVGEVLRRKVLCNISMLELSPLDGASISLTLRESQEGLPF